MHTQGKQDDTTTCEVCERTAKTATHPCRFEKGCTCWRGKPCKGKGTVRASVEETRHA
jgi:hypothetical protein